MDNDTGSRQYDTWRLSEVCQWLTDTGRMDAFLKAHNAECETAHTAATFTAFIEGFEAGAEIMLDVEDGAGCYKRHRELQRVDAVRWLRDNVFEADED